MPTSTLGFAGEASAIGLLDEELATISLGRASSEGLAHKGSEASK